MHVARPGSETVGSSALCGQSGPNLWVCGIKPNKPVAEHQPAGATGPRRAPRAGGSRVLPEHSLQGKILLFNCYVEISL